jgi:hypothetical protein
VEAVVAGAAGPDDASPALDGSPVLDDSPPAAPGSADDFAALVLPDAADDARSFFAHPEPLKWTADVVMPLRIVPSAPQAGQNLGPGSWIPWITSVTSLQRAQP